MTARRDPTARWLYFAGEDLRSATILHKEGIFSQSCLHSHQCAEKLLKAFLVFKGVALKKVHDLNELLQCCLTSGGHELKRFEDDLSILNTFYVPTRYPDGMPGSLSDRLPNKQDSAEALSIAQKLHGSMMRIIPQTARSSG